MKKWVNNSLYAFGGMILGVSMASVSEPVEADAKEPVAVVAKAEVKPVAVTPVKVDKPAPEAVVEAPVAKPVVVKPTAPEVAKPEGIRSADAKTACNERIKEETIDFAEVDIKYLSDAVFLKDASGKATASIGFTVNDGHGTNKPFVGYCYFNADKSLRTFEIQEGRR